MVEVEPIEGWTESKTAIASVVMIVIDALVVLIPMLNKMFGLAILTPTAEEQAALGALIVTVLTLMYILYRRLTVVSGPTASAIEKEKTKTG
ncbi:MAG: hypothetical protein O8C67_15380 [Candidatus Methanoperedens sp.]|nr:hypothetical protein [Candidatus Methanoperedens sp.]